MNDKCKDIKCTSVEDPKCVNIRHLTDLKNVIYVVAVNKCEIQYMRCHEDYDAKIVPMKNCGHDGLDFKFKHDKRNTTGYTRIRRDAERQLGIKARIKQISVKDAAGNATGQSGVDGPYQLLPRNLANQDQSEDVEEDTEFPLISRETANNYNAATKMPDPQFEEDCPEHCPSRGVMVCARCRHGVYKTFVSVCHVRMFTCSFNDEVLYLVSRYPCVLSAPFISAKGMIPRVEVREANDDDIVLRYIKCHGDDGKLKTHVQDPRCAFEEGGDGRNKTKIG